MFKHWLVRGDTHGHFNWMCNGALDTYKPEETAIIILGDAGFNFYLNNTDDRKKAEVNARGYRFYCVRGNHEARPQDVDGMKATFDAAVDGWVYLQEEYPNIRYFMDYGIYTLDGYSAAVIGGAYSVDKWWRLLQAGMNEENNNPKRSGWFWNEQLTTDEMKQAAELFKGKSFDFVLSHTCPRDWEPTDLFLSFINQSEVDQSMENWMNEIKDTFDWKVWVWGHFHDDRIERPHCEMFYNDIEELDVIIKRWDEYDKTGKLDWWLKKSPNFYQFI